VPIVLKSGSLNHLEPLGPVQVCNGIALYLYLIIKVSDFRIFSVNDINLFCLYQVSHVFQNYGPGVRFIRFFHGGMDTQFWAGHYGSKMSGACVKLMIPVPAKSRSSIAEDESNTEEHVL